MVKHRIVRSIFGLLVACGPREAANVRTQTCSPAAQKQPEQPKSYRAMIYSAAFAERFSMPKGGVQPLDAGLQAVVLRVLERFGDVPTCYLDFYVDATLDLAFPEGSEGTMVRADDENPLFFARSLEGPEDHRWDPMLGSFHAVACRKTPGDCLFQEGGPFAYSRHLLPGVAFQTYPIMCSALDPKHGPTEMWLLRAGRDAKELYAGSTDEGATYRFSMPAALFEHAAARTRQAMKVYEDGPLPKEPERGNFTVPGGPQ